MEPVSELRSKILPALRSWAQRLKTDHPAVAVNVYDHSIGEVTDYQGHAIGIDCVLERVPLGQADNVALEISLKHLHKAPTIESADVVWGHPGGDVEVSILSAPVDFSIERLVSLVEQLPDLLIGLQRTLRRGCPPPAT